MDEIESNPRMLPRASAPMPDDIRGVIPEISLMLNDSRTPKKLPYNANQFVPRDNSGVRQGTPKHPSVFPLKNSTTTVVQSSSSLANNYPQDMRLKFYQKLQSKVDSNRHPVRPRQSPELSLTLKESPPIRNTYDPSLIPRPYNGLINQSPKKSPTKSNENDSIRQLFKLVEKQNEKIESLKLQLKMLQVKNQNNEIDRYIESQKIKKLNEIRNKENHKQISIGVMTSFEFNTQKPVNNYVEKGINTSYIVEGIETGVNTEKSPEYQLEKIAENTTMSPLNQSIPAMYPDVEKNIFDDQRYLEDETVRPTPAKVGRTFYNNVLCQVNEILHNSADNHESKRSQLPDTTQKCTTKQVKIIETTITTGVASEIETPNPSNKAPADSSYYPRVNYHGGIMQSTHSISDTNASIHMKALALKYLGNKYQPDGPMYKREVEFLSNFVADNASADYSASLGTRNYVDKYHLVADRSHSPLKNWNDS